MPLSTLLQMPGLATGARYPVFHCADDLLNSSDGRGLYYESIDLVDAFHPQTIMAPSGTARRCACGHQLGYKMAKYVMRIEVVESFANIGRGRGGFWEDLGYAWYAGI